MTFIHNKAKHSGGALNFHNSSNMLFDEKSYTIFTDNNAELGGAVCLEVNATVTYKGNSLIEFFRNNTEQNGGAVLHVHSKGTFQENSTVKFIDNTAKINGGAACFSSNSNITFDKYSTCLITFHNNEATQGGALYSERNMSITIGGQSQLIFISNNASFGGAIYCTYNTFIMTRGNSLITFTNNTALNQGGALIIKQNSDVRLKEISNVIFDSNKLSIMVVQCFQNLILNFILKATVQSHLMAIQLMMAQEEQFLLALILLLSLKTALL